MKKKIFITLFFILVLLTNISFASYSTVTMEVVEDPVCSIELGENSKFEKKLISKDLTNKEVTLQLEVTNEEAPMKPTGEIMLVLDNSNSMTDESSNGKIRKDLVFDSTKYLISNLLKDNTNLKIGVVQFSTNIDLSKEGTIDDASVVSSLTNDVTSLNNAITSIDTNGSRTDLQAGLLLASQQFTKTNNNKYMIVLTDGVPNVAINFADKTYYSEDVINKTKKQLQDLNNQGIKIITMLTGINDPSYNPLGDKTFEQIITEVFGTSQNPTAGEFYYVTDDQVQATITNDIYNSLLPINKSFTNITIVDYFPQEIIDNFDFAYVTKATIGNISAEINKTNNSITWTIPQLTSGQTATVQYKLKLKENFNSNIVNKILNTNQKVDLSYTDFDSNNQNKTSDISPKLKLSEPPAVLPKAGFTTLIVIFGIFAISLLVFSITKLTKINRNIK